MQITHTIQPEDFLHEETRNGYFVSKEMKKLWAVQMELLTKLLEVCEKHNLKIWAEGGTLLGTIREKGYIPWDDDIDMAMLRPDYNKLIAISQEEFKSPFFFQCGYTEINYPRGHAQIRKDGTTAIIASDVGQKFHQGVFIDIFVYDSIPNNDAEIDLLKNKVEDDLKELQTYCYKPYSIYNIKENFRLLKLKHKVNKIGFKQLFANFDKDLSSYDQTNCKNVSCIGFKFDFKHYLRNIHVFDQTLYMPFEYIMIPVPVGYDNILSTQYGDYMKPVKAPTCHGGFLVLDTEKSYTEYLPKLRRDRKIKSWKYRIHRLQDLFFHNK